MPNALQFTPLKSPVRGMDGAAEPDSAHNANAADWATVVQQSGLMHSPAPAVPAADAWHKANGAAAAAAPATAPVQQLRPELSTLPRERRRVKSRQQRQH